MGNLTYSDFDKNAVLTMQLANQSAWKLNHDYIDTEHILIGMCRNLSQENVELFTQFGVTTKQLMAELKRRVRRGLDPVEQSKRPVRTNAKRVTEHAVKIATESGALAVSTNHLLLGMLHVDGSVAADVLTTLGMRYDHAIARIKET